MIVAVAMNAAASPILSISQTSKGFMVPFVG